ASPKISPKLQNSIKQGQVMNILINFKTGTDDVLREISETVFPDRIALLRQLTAALMANSVQSQGQVRNFLQSNSSWIFDPLWVTDQIWVKDASEELIQRLTEFTDVDSIVEDELTLFGIPPLKDEAAIGRRNGILA